MVLNQKWIWPSDKSNKEKVMTYYEYLVDFLREFVLEKLNSSSDWQGCDWWKTNRIPRYINEMLEL